MIDFCTNSFFFILLSPEIQCNTILTSHAFRVFVSNASGVVRDSPFIIEGCEGGVALFFFLATAKTHNKDLTASELQRQTQLQYKCTVKKVNELLNTFKQHTLKVNAAFNMGLSNSKGTKITLLR